jgi:hypothetical protein
VALGLVAGLIGLVVGLLALALFLNRAVHASRTLGGVGFRHGARWALWGWVVPIAAFFVPKRVIDDLWRSAVPVREHWDGARLTAPRGSSAAWGSGSLRTRRCPWRT